MTDLDKLMDYVYNNPLALLTLKDQRDIDIVDSYLPYSTGFEIECSKANTFKDKYFNLIPDIMSIDCDGGEQRYRIPNGINGLLCLYNICNQLKLHSMLNMGSGIHYHIDCRGTFSKLVEHIGENPTYKESILKKLDTWNYMGTYNPRDISDGRKWVRMNSRYCTFEFRIGEMSFDYQVLVKRIIHANDIIRDLKREVTGKSHTTFTKFNRDKILKYIKGTSINKQLLNTLRQNKDISTTVDPKKIMNDRVIKL
jgi:hypothetical protein